MLIHNLSTAIANLIQFRIGGQRHARYCKLFVTLHACGYYRPYTGVNFAVCHAVAWAENAARYHSPGPGEAPVLPGTGLFAATASTDSSVPRSTCNLRGARRQPLERGRRGTPSQKTTRAGGCPGALAAVARCRFAAKLVDVGAIDLVQDLAIGFATHLHPLHCLVIDELKGALTEVGVNPLVADHVQQRLATVHRYACLKVLKQIMQ